MYILIWCHGIAVIIPDCLSGDRGSIPRGIAKSIYEWISLFGFDDWANKLHKQLYKGKEAYRPTVRWHEASPHSQGISARERT